MLKTEQMSKLTVIGPKTVMKEVIGRLYKLKIYHIVDHKKTEELDIGSPTEKSGDISEILVKTRSLCSSMSIELAKEDAETAEAKLDTKKIEALKKRVEKIHAVLESKSENLKNTEESMKKLEEKRELFEKLEYLNLDIGSYSEYQSISYIVGIIEKVKDISALRKDIKKHTSKYKLYHTGYGSKTIIAIFFEISKRNEIMDMLSKKGLSEIELSSVKGLKGDVSKHIRKINFKISKLSKEKNAIQKDIESLKKEEKDFLVKTENMLAVEAEKAEAPLRFASTEKAFVIRGWVPARKLSKTTKELNLVSKEKIYIESEPVRKEEDIPVKLKNPKLVQPFEFFMDLYTLPKYKEIDPTFLMFLTFPLFYGFMLGDVGYGLITLTLFLILRRKIKGDFGRLINAMIFAAISTIIFGALFAEYFGVELYHPILVNRLHDTQGLMIMSVVIGFVHVNIGLLVGFYNELRAHGFVAAMFEKLSWLVLEAGVVVLALAYTDVLNGYSALKPLPWVGYLILAVAVAMIYKGEGAKGLVEIPAIFSHMLSYIRLMAVGLASVILAAVVNDLAGGLFSAGIIGIIGGILLLLIGHTINIALGLISPFLHSLRLHYVEFFTKFYQGGGMRYVPFGTRSEE